MTVYISHLPYPASDGIGYRCCCCCRLDQITQLLKSGVMEVSDDHDLPASQESSDHQSVKKSELELERREVIGEILKLNSSYKAPGDYKPLLKEDKVAILIKEYPGRNSVGLIFGPAGDTQKRLEKETGAKIRVYGTKADTKEEANTVAVSTNDPVSRDDPNAETPVLINYGVAQFTGSGPAPPLGRFQQYHNQWVPTGASSGFIASHFPNLSAPIQVSSTPSTSVAMPSSFGPRDVMSGPHGSVPHNQQPMVQHPHMLQMPNMGYAGPHRNPSLPPLQVSPGQPNLTIQN